MSGRAHALPVIRDEVDWISVCKPAGLATIPGRGDDNSVLQCLARQIHLPSTGENDPRLRVVHRLDKHTSGVLLFAKTAAAQRHFSEQFRHRLAHKEYLALVAGAPEADEGDIDAPLARHPKSPRHMAVARHGGRSARTLWKVERRFGHLTLLRVFPKTGKTHQIRVHLAHIGLPLAIDPLYNAPRDGAPPGIFLSTIKRNYRPKSGIAESPLIDRLTLHSEVLTVVSPTGESIRLSCPLPKDFAAVLAQLARHARR
jgi:23S rRNA pseudouridine955/2504/2580 synthase/23S rRNA pseudouridine1911/1915/1917 synthase